MVMFPEFHPQCSASAAILSKKKVTERDSEPRDPTDAVKDWVKSVGVLKAGWYNRPELDGMKRFLIDSL